MMQQCRSCKEFKSYSYYHKDKCYKSGFKSICKECAKKIRKKYPPKKSKKPKNTNTHKYCMRCATFKVFGEFPKNIRTNDGFKSYCIICTSEYNKQYHAENRDEILKNNKARKRYIKSISKVIPNNKKCSSCLKIKNSIDFNVDNASIDGLSSWCKTCRCNYANTEHAKQLIKKRNLIRSKNPYVRLRNSVSSSIRRALRRNSGFKTSSISNYLPYTILKLKNHIESLWAPWMSWGNYGKANTNKKTWHIDHIIPQSKLPYDSMDHPNFLKCWSLDNLRPLEAIQNIKKSNKIIG
jgi:hypothetical protein